MRLPSLTVGVAVLTAVVALQGCSNDQSSTSEPGTTPPVFSSAAPPCPGGVPDGGTGPTGSACDPRAAAGQPVELGQPTPVDIPADALVGTAPGDGLVGIYAPQWWGAGAAGLACEVTDPTNQPLPLQPPVPGDFQPLAVEGAEWVAVWTYPAVAGKSTVNCHDDGTGRLPADGPQYVRAALLSIAER